VEPTLIQDVSDTAFWVAHYRAVESDRPNALFQDPLAGLLAGERGRQIAASMPGGKATQWVVALRTRIIDDLVMAGLGQGVDAVLNLGSGLDTRPYRLALPAGLRWIEVDQPGVLEFKERVLQGQNPVCRLERVGMDITNQDARRKLFEDLDSTCSDILVLTEGVILYLETKEVASLARDLRAYGHISGWITEFKSERTLRQMARRHADRARLMQNAPLKFNPANWSGFFSEQGWEISQERGYFSEARKLRYPVPASRAARLVMKIAAMLPFGKRQVGPKDSEGYALLKPKPASEEPATK
jgi:methyltransferase (TIGR00027 family)